MTALTTDQRALLTARLAEAEDAYHKWAMGAMVAEYHDSNGERVVYSKANQVRLGAYIADLKRQLGIGCATGPLNVWIG